MGIVWVVIFLFAFIYIGAYIFAGIGLAVYLVYLIAKHLFSYFKLKYKQRHIHKLNKKYLRDRLRHLP